MNEVKETGPQMFVLSCISVDLGFLCLNQGVEKMNQFLHIFRERLIVCRWQEWHSHVETSDRFNVYRTFCTIHDTKTYLKMNIDRHLKFINDKVSIGYFRHCCTSLSIQMTY